MLLVEEGRESIEPIMGKKDSDCCTLIGVTPRAADVVGLDMNCIVRRSSGKEKNRI